MAEKQEKIYAGGFRTFAPTSKAPDFVIGTLIINIDEFSAWLKKEGKEYITEYKDQKQVNLNIVKAKDGRPTFYINTYKKDDDNLGF